MKKWLLIYIALLTCLIACKQKVSFDSNKATLLKKDDSAFLALKDTAQLYIQTFIDSLKVYGRDTTKFHFQIKSDYVDGDIHEHMWSNIYTYKNGLFDGLFADTAFQVRNIKNGAKVTIKKSNVEDWLIYNVAKDQTIGYFSEEYLMSKKKRQQN